VPTFRGMVFRARARFAPRDRIVHPCAYTRGKLQHRAFIPYRTRAVTQFRRAECDTFSCIIKSRVTRALYIIHAAASRHPAFAIAHPPPRLSFSPIPRPLPHCSPPPCSLRFLLYAGGLISRGRVARDSHKTHRMPQRQEHAAAISSARQDLLAQYLRRRRSRAATLAIVPRQVS